MPSKEHPPTDFRRMRRQNDRTTLMLVMFVLIVLGGALIGLIWGWRAAITGGICLISGAVLIGGLWLLLSLIEKWVGE